MSEDEVTIENFKDKISTGNVVVDVWMDDCSYCVEYAPIFDAVAETTPDVTFLKFKLNPKELTSEWKSTYFKVKAGEVMKAPATLVFKDGVMVNRKFGSMTQAQLEDFLGMKSLEDLLAEKWDTIAAMNAAGKKIAELNGKDQTKLTQADKVAGGLAATTIDSCQRNINERLNPMIQNLMAAGATVDVAA